MVKVVMEGEEGHGFIVEKFKDEWCKEETVKVRKWGAILEGGVNEQGDLVV